MHKRGHRPFGPHQSDFHLFDFPARPSDRHALTDFSCSRSVHKLANLSVTCSNFAVGPVESEIDVSQEKWTSWSFVTKFQLDMNGNISDRSKQANVAACESLSLT